jgi:hypothetical protein
MMRWSFEMKAFSEFKPTFSMRLLAKGLRSAFSVGTRKRKQFCPVLIFFWDLGSTSRTVRDFQLCQKRVPPAYSASSDLRVHHPRLLLDRLALLSRFPG